MATGLARVADWPGEAKAAGWVRRDGHRETVGDSATPLRLASVTKVLTAMAILVAVEEESIDLDEPAGPVGSTVRHLLSHCSGLPFEGSIPIALPGQRRIYGNAAFQVLGDLLTERSGLVVGDYVLEAVCVPLGMHDTEIHGSPAHGGVSTVDDLLKLAHELLVPGSVLDAHTLAAATAVQFPDLDGVLPGFGRQRPNPWGLGFEIHGGKAPHWMPDEASTDCFGHFGQSGSFLWVDPVAGVACCGLAQAAFGDWARREWPALGAEVLAGA